KPLTGKHLRETKAAIMWRDYLTSFGDPLCGGFNQNESIRYAHFLFLLNRLHSNEFGSPYSTENPTYVGLHFGWRRGRDSNPRYRFQYDSLANCSFRPLRHLSLKLTVQT